jgi:hypothetical protein
MPFGTVDMDASAGGNIKSYSARSARILDVRDDITAGHDCAGSRRYAVILRDHEDAEAEERQDGFRRGRDQRVGRSE